MKHIFCFLLLFLFSSNVCLADTEDRYAIIEDTSNQEFEVKDLTASGTNDDRWQNMNDPFISIYVPPLTLAVPIKKIMLVEHENDGYVMKYIYSGSDIKVFGQLDYNLKLSGNTDFGVFSLEGKFLESITFSTAPEKRDQTESMIYPDIIELDNGTRIPVKIDSRTNYFYDSTGYIMGGESYTHHYSDFKFKRGQSVLSLPFKDIASLEFTFDNKTTSPLQGDVVVTLKNGKTTSGMLSDQSREILGGLSGICKKGHFYIAARHLKKVIFSPDQ